MIINESISNLKSKLTESIQLINDLTNSDTLQTYTLSDDTQITYFTALIRSFIERGWQPVGGIIINPKAVIDAFILNGNLSIYLGPLSVRKLLTIQQVTFPPMKLK